MVESTQDVHVFVLPSPSSAKTSSTPSTLWNRSPLAYCSPQRFWKATTNSLRSATDIRLKSLMVQVRCSAHQSPERTGSAPPPPPPPPPPPSTALAELVEPEVVGVLLLPPPPSAMNMCPSVSTKLSGLPPARAYRFWVSGSEPSPRSPSAVLSTSCWRNRPVSGPNRRAPMSIVCDPESQRLAENRYGLT